MSSDLTERLAAKLMQAGYPTHDAVEQWCELIETGRGSIESDSAQVAVDAAKLLPLLLSEPELVAGLAPEVKREVLRVLARDIPEKGMMEAPVHYDASEAWAWAVGWTALREHLLAPSPAPMEGTNDE